MINRLSRKWEINISPLMAVYVALNYQLISASINDDLAQKAILSIQRTRNSMSTCLSTIFETTFDKDDTREKRNSSQ